MATFEEHIEGLTQIDITATSAPTINELTEILKEGLIHTVNTITTLKPEELPKFTETTNGTGGIAKFGKVLSVNREHDHPATLRVCTPINPSLRFEATDEESLHYRSKYNPAYYELNNTIFCIPTPNDSSNNDLVVTQVKYDTGLVATDNYNAGAVLYFPTDYEYLLGLYGAALACNVAANNIHNNMPTEPVAPVSPDFTNEDVVLPTLPTFIPPKINFNFNAIISAISRQDLELADKNMSLFDKRVEEYTKKYDNENGYYLKELEIFKADLDKLTKDSDRAAQIEVSEYKSEMEKYTAEIQFFQSDLQEAMTQYKWYTSQHISFMNQYNLALGIKYQQPKQKEEPKPRKRSN